MASIHTFTVPPDASLAPWGKPTTFSAYPRSLDSIPCVTPPTTPIAVPAPRSMLSPPYDLPWLRGDPCPWTPARERWTREVPRFSGLRLESPRLQSSVIRGRGGGGSGGGGTGGEQEITERKERPKTSTVVARRMISRALGVRLEVKSKGKANEGDGDAKVDVGVRASGRAGGGEMAVGGKVVDLPTGDGRRNDDCVENAGRREVVPGCATEQSMAENDEHMLQGKESQDEQTTQTTLPETRLDQGREDSDDVENSVEEEGKSYCSGQEVGAWGGDERIMLAIKAAEMTLSDTRLDLGEAEKLIVKHANEDDIEQNSRGEEDSAKDGGKAMPRSGDGEMPKTTPPEIIMSRGQGSFGLDGSGDEGMHLEEQKNCRKGEDKVQGGGYPKKENKLTSHDWLWSIYACTKEGTR